MPAQLKGSMSSYRPPNDELLLELHRTMTLDPKEGVPVGGPPMPDHWRIDELTRFPRLKTMLLYIGVGRSTAEECWERSYHGPAYEEGRGQLRESCPHERGGRPGSL